MDQQRGLGRSESDRNDDDEPVAVLVVDDRDSFRAVMREVVAAAPGFALAGEASSGEAALDAAPRLSPSIVLMDARMPGMGGVEACRQITARHPDVLVLLASVDALAPELARDCGAAAIVRKQDLSPRLLVDVWRQNAASRRSPGAE